MIESLADQARRGPKDLDELLRMLPGIRKMRRINADTLRTLLDRPRRTCTWCGDPVAKGRSTWCGQDCVDAFMARCDPATQVSLVRDRDGDICVACGRDTKKAEQDANRELTQARAAGKFIVPESIAHPIRQRYGWARGRWREVDHIFPVSLGGGLLGIANLRLLCGVCHLEETNKLAKLTRQAKPG